jgi:hypothetical protein
MRLKTINKNTLNSRINSQSTRKPTTAIQTKLAREGELYNQNNISLLNIPVPWCFSTWPGV